MRFTLRPRTKLRRGELSRKEKTIVRSKLFERESSVCQDCGTPVIWESGFPNSGHAAHIVSAARGGPFALPNLQLLCPKCHLILDHNPKSVSPKRTPCACICGCTREALAHLCILCFVMAEADPGHGRRAA